MKKFSEHLNATDNLNSSILRPWWIHPASSHQPDCESWSWQNVFSKLVNLSYPCELCKVSQLDLQICSKCIRVVFQYCVRSTSTSTITYWPFLSVRTTVQSSNQPLEDSLVHKPVCPYSTCWWNVSGQRHLSLSSNPNLSVSPDCTKTPDCKPFHLLLRRALPSHKLYTAYHWSYAAPECSRDIINNDKQSAVYLRIEHDY